MKKYRCYLRAVLLSIAAAVIIDTALHFEEYQAGWATTFSQPAQESGDYDHKTAGSAKAGKVTTVIIEAFRSM